MTGVIRGNSALTAIINYINEWYTGVIRGNSALIANVGDSRAVGSISGRAVALSVDHKPNLPAERARIQNAGGTVWVHVTAPVGDCSCVWLLLCVAGTRTVCMHVCVEKLCSCTCRPTSVPRWPV